MQKIECGRGTIPLWGNPDKRTGFSVSVLKDAGRKECDTLSSRKFYGVRRTNTVRRGLLLCKGEANFTAAILKARKIAVWDARNAKAAALVRLHSAHSRVLFAHQRNFSSYRGQVNQYEDK